MSHFAKAALAAALFIVVAFCSALAFGGEQVTRDPWKWDLRDDTTGAPIKDAKGVPIRTETEKQCEDAGKALLAGKPSFTWRCTTTVRFTAVGVCDATNTKPEPEVIDGEGFRVYPDDPAPEECPAPWVNSYRIVEQRWITVYPTCGEYKPVEIQACGYVVPEPPDGPMPPPPAGSCVGCDPAAPALP